MTKIFAALALALPLAAVAQTGYIHANGDPRVTGKDCGQSRFYIDDTTGQMYVSGAGSPCVWTLPGASAPPPINAQTATYQVLASGPRPRPPILARQPMRP